jgi:hypothetical protein
VLHGPLPEYQPDAARLEVTVVDEDVGIPEEPVEDVPEDLPEDVPAELVDAGVADVPRDAPAIPDVPCGASDQPCCAGSTCGTGTTCVAAVCRPCGAVNQPCCGTNTCNTGMVCASGACRACGAVGQPCCTGSRCTADSNPCTLEACSSGTCRRTTVANGTSAGSLAEQRCCGGVAVDISTSTRNCGGCGLACASGQACEPVETTTSCSDHTANRSGRCRCASGLQCPVGRNGAHQTCRTYTPYSWRCTPDSSSYCASGETYVDISSCPNYCRY